MKKVKGFLFVIFLLAVFILSSCAAKENVLLNSDEDILQPQNFSFETEYNEYSKDVTTISFLITNTSDDEIAVSTETFDLQYKFNGEWKTVAFKQDTDFYDLATVLKPNESTRGKISLEKYYHLPLSAGEYRIIKNSYASNVFKIY